jgi:hypothetical protein
MMPDDDGGDAGDVDSKSSRSYSNGDSHITLHPPMNFCTALGYLLGDMGFNFRHGKQIISLLQNFQMDGETH